MSNSTDILQRLEQFTPCDVADGLVHLGIRTGGFLPNLTRQSPTSKTPSRSISGKAYTVLYAPLSDPRPAIKGGYIDAIPPDSIVVVGLTPELQIGTAPFVKVRNALYGGLMSTRAQYLGAKGSVILGRIRDINEHRQLGYTVFSYGVGVTAPGPVVKVVGVNVPLEVVIAGEESTELIEPGEWIIGDENGVVHIHHGIDLEELLSYVPKRVAADELVAQDIKQGKPAAASQKQRRANL